MHLLYLFRLLGGGLLVGISGMACCCQARHEPAPTGVPQTSLRPAMQCTVNSELQCFGEIEAATNLDAKQCSALEAVCTVQCRDRYANAFGALSLVTCGLGGTPSVVLVIFFSR